MANENETVEEIVKNRLLYLDGEHSAWVSESVENARDFVLELLEAHKREMDTRTIIAGAMLADAVDEAHKREVAELYAIIEKSQKDAETYRDERDGAMRHWREEKAKVAELRECLKEACRYRCGKCNVGNLETESHFCGNYCDTIKRWRKALETTKGDES